MNAVRTVAPAGPRPGARGVPLTAAQTGIWHAQADDPGSPAHNTAECVEIHGPLDPVLFAEALHRTIGEADALRVRVEETPDGPRQFALAIEPPGHGFPLHATDLRDQGDPDAVAGAWMGDDLTRPFDLAGGPLFRHALFQVGERRWLWYQRVHRIVLDGFGYALVARRAAEVYTALAAGREAGPSPFGRLADLRAEETAYRDSDAYDIDRGHWSDAFADRPEAATLTGRTARPSRTFLRRTARVGAGAATGIEALAAAIHATWPEVVIATQALYVAHATHRGDIVLGLPMMARAGSAALRVPATAVNLLPLRVTVTPQTTFAELTLQVTLGIRAARRHQRYRYEDIRRDLGLADARRALVGPQVNVMPFDYGPEFAGARSEARSLAAGPVDDLTVHVYGRGDGAGLRIDYDGNPALYEERELAAHQARFLDLLGRIADSDPHAQPSRP
ncbi:condensation domain-containing protein [Streptomyces halobius]|uniref:condensation domain-containing protein n=1 Tax=Streptomyces halobius TaxID=2879846 RepID=UPI0029E7E313|nr:condensation domain-containing protein [Streptomyces halobius]